MTIQEVVAWVYRARLDLLAEGRKPAWVLLSASRYRELQVWHRQLGELHIGDYISPDKLFEMEIALDNAQDFLVLDSERKAAPALSQKVPTQ